MAYNDAIASIESIGRYDKLGPMTKGDRAYGRYQVMGANIPEWTKAALGRSMTPQEFLANPQAQDAVFAHRFGSYVQKYGPEGAARAWFAGEGGMNDPNRRDVLGTSVSDYANKFNAAMANQPPRPPMPIPQQAPNLPLFPPNAMASAAPQQAAPQGQPQPAGQPASPSIFDFLSAFQRAPNLPLFGQPDRQQTYGG